MSLHDNNAFVVRAITERAHPLRDTRDLAPLINDIGQHKIVMLGESSHGTHEFYEWRRQISQELIANHGFKFIAVEGDWPPCWQLNRYIRSREKSASNAATALAHFDRWPTWMWANAELIELAEWLKARNAGLPREKQAGFFGLDVYSLFESIDSVLKQLEAINPFLARRARQRYACFEPYQRDEKAYARSLVQFPEGCQTQVLASLEDLLTMRLESVEHDERAFDAQQNARIVANAERYYRAMIHGDEDSWNIRDSHMLETLDMLLDHHGLDAKAIVWAHNTHIGDYRATDMAAQGQINIGGLAREKWGEDNVALVGFGTHRGQVVASHSWDGPIEILAVPEGQSGSYEHFFHLASEELRENAFFLKLRSKSTRDGPLNEVRGHRAIGVVYHPSYERLGNYVPTQLASRYDAFVFIDETNALRPLNVRFKIEDIPETWPRGV